MKKAILCTSFGTSVDAAMESIAAVEKALCAAVPDRFFARAFTSSIIRRILEKRGQPVMGVEQALEALAAAGAEDVFVQPTHILCGSEYERPCRGRQMPGRGKPSCSLATAPTILRIWYIRPCRRHSGCGGGGIFWWAQWRAGRPLRM